MTPGAWLLEVARHLAGLLATVLPERTKRWGWLAGLPMGRLHVLSGVAEILVGLTFFVQWMLAYVDRFTAEFGYTYLASRPSLSHGVIGSMGILGYVSFLLTPAAWFALYLVFEGVIRVLEVLLHSRRPGMLLVVLGAWIGRRVSRLVNQVRLRHTLGPNRPDRLVGHPGAPGAGLELWTVTRYPWRDGHVIRFGAELYVVQSCRLTPDDAHHAWVFHLRALEPGELIRGQVGVYPPPEPKAPQGRRGPASRTSAERKA